MVALADWYILPIPPPIGETFQTFKMGFSAIGSVQSYSPWTPSGGFNINVWAWVYCPSRWLTTWILQLHWVDVRSSGQWLNSMQLDRINIPKFVLRYTYMQLFLWNLQRYSLQLIKWRCSCHLVHMVPPVWWAASSWCCCSIYHTVVRVLSRDLDYLE